MIVDPQIDGDEPEAHPDFVAKCEGYSKVLKRGDIGMCYAEEFIYMCEDCAETYRDLRERAEKEPEAFEDWKATLAWIDEELASGKSLTDKLVWEL